MNVSPYIVGRKNSDDATVCENRMLAEMHISDLISEGEDEDNIVVYTGHMLIVHIVVERSAKVSIGVPK